MADKDGAQAGEASSGWPETDPFTIESVSAEVYRAPTSRTVRTSFGVMQDRPAVVVRIRSSEGLVGHGEAWCNFPAPAAEYRARLIVSVLAPLILGREWPHPAAVYEYLSSKSRIVAIQSGEPGPFSQAIAGIDIALWDMAARGADKPLWRLLGGDPSGGGVAAYASGIGPDGATEQAGGALEAGYRAFKLKVGFGEETDLGNLEALRWLLGPDTPIAVDANQAWSPEEAARWSRTLGVYSPMWLEEPIAADLPARVWTRLAEISPIPLAGGENLSSQSDFRRAIRDGALAVIQPDVTKWGGISGCLPVAREALGAGRRFCPLSASSGRKRSWWWWSRRMCPR